MWVSEALTVSEQQALLHRTMSPAPQVGTGREPHLWSPCGVLLTVTHAPGLLEGTLHCAEGTEAEDGAHAAEGLHAVVCPPVLPKGDLPSGLGSG